MAQKIPAHDPGKATAISPAGTEPVSKDAMYFLKAYWLPLLLVILAIIFIATNTNSTTFTVFWVNITQPLWMLLTGTVIVGFIIGWFVGRRGRR